MSWTYLVYFLLGALLFWGAKLAGKGEWNEEYTSLKQTKALQGIMMLGVVLHHMAQKTCASWQPAIYRVHGLDFFLPYGYLFVGVFFFCSGLGLWKSVRSKSDYLKGFCRRRILPIVIAFYLAEFIYTGARLLTGEQMDLTRILWYLSGLHMANVNAWYVIVIPFFYLVFWLAFRVCKKHEGTAIFLVFLFTMAYTVLCAAVGHQNDWWIRGEWWYNSVLLFPIGLTFGKFEKGVTRFFRRGYWIWLVVFAAAVVLMFRHSEWVVNRRLGYYVSGSLGRRVGYSVLSALTQWLAALAFTAFCFLAMMKVKIGNKVLAWIGAMTLDIYLIHGLFVELFGYSFLDSGRKVLYIKDIGPYAAAVLGCSAAAALLFRYLRKGVMALPARVKTAKQKRKDGEIYGKPFWKKPGIWVAVGCLLLAVIGMVLLFRTDPGRVVGGLKVTPPEGYRQGYTDTRYQVWEYSGSDRKPGRLVLDEDIRGYNAEKFGNAESFMESCDWLEDIEIYVNPYGIRMVRGFSEDGSGYPDRRYYVECDKNMFLLSMIEDSRYYDPQDCEAVMQEVADSIRRE